MDRECWRAARRRHTRSRWSALGHTDGRGDIAQNINFGVKASVLRSFLHACNVRPSLMPRTPVSRAEVARQARSFLYRINVTY